MLSKIASNVPIQLNCLVFFFSLSSPFFFYLRYKGVLWVNNKPIDGSSAVLNRLQQLGKRVYFVTNNATRSRNTYVKIAHERGFDIQKDQIVTPILAIVSYLKSLNFDKKIYTIGRGVIDELKEYNIHCADDSDDEPIQTHYSNITEDSLNLDPNVGAVLVNHNLSTELITDMN